MTSGRDAVRSVGYWQLIRLNDRFRRLWAAELISAAGDWFNTVAVLGLVLQLTQGGLAVSLVLLSSTLPMFFLTPIAGPVVDAIDRRNLMVVTNLVSAGVALLFLLVHDSSMVWLTYVASILLVISASFFAPAASASIPNIVTEAELYSANALGSSTWGIMVMVGSALGGIVSTLFGRESAFIINSLSFLIAAALIATIKIPSPRKEVALAPWKDFVEGVRYLRGYSPALALVAVKMGWGIAGGVIVLLSVFGQQVFKAGDAGIGIMYAARGAGALIGPFAVRAIAGRHIKNQRHALWISFALSGIGYGLLAWSGFLGSIWLAAAALMIAHFGGGINWVVSSVLLQITTPDRLRGRVFAVDYGLSTLTTGISTVIFGLALQAGVLPMTLAASGALMFIIYGVIWGLGTARGPFQISESTVSLSDTAQTASTL